VLQVADSIWPAERILSDAGTFKAGSGIVINSRSIASHSHALVNGIKYGAFSWVTGRSSGYAYIHGRRAVRIEHILTLSGSKGSQVFERPIALVRAFREVHNAPVMPWDTL
jgi:hypothetical protein